MSTKLNEINDKLAEQLTQGWSLNREDLFNLGVELGRELAAHNLVTYRSPIWEKREKENKQDLEIRNAVDKIEDFIATLVKLSVTEKIEETGSWSIAKGGGYTLEKFSDEIVKKYNVQVLRCDMESYGGEFTVTFSVEGELAKLFKKHNVYDQFTVRIYNDCGEDHQAIYNVKEVDNYIDSVTAHIRDGNGWELGKCEDFLLEISKPYLFLITKNIY